MAEVLNLWTLNLVILAPRTNLVQRMPTMCNIAFVIPLTGHVKTTVQTRRDEKNKERLSKNLWSWIDYIIDWFIEENKDHKVS